MGLLDLASETGGEFGDLRRDGIRVRWWGGDLEAPQAWRLGGNTLVMCFNLSGRAVGAGSVMIGEIGPGQLAVAAAPSGRGSLRRVGGGRHEFVLLELRRSWVARWLPQETRSTREPVRRFLEVGAAGGGGSGISAISRAAGDVVRQFFDPPAVAGGLEFWRHGKALEAAAHGMFEPEEEFFCRRTQRIASDRVERVRQILAERFEAPPPLAELGRLVGCSPFYLSRIFRDETGQTISQCLRGARLARAAEMLRGGEGNVTEAAMAVGYSSLSHFSKAFAKEFGCCPCFYGAKNNAGMRESVAASRR